MKTFADYVKSKSINEAFGTNTERKARQYLSDPHFGQSFLALMKVHGRDVGAAIVEFERLRQTPSGQYKLLQLASKMPPADISGGDGDERFVARSTNHKDIFSPKNGTVYSNGGGLGGSVAGGI